MVSVSLSRLSIAVDCDLLPNPTNGQVSNNGTTFGETVTYSCNTGYDLVGDNTRTCQATGNWSGSAPTCECMLLLSNMPIKYVHNVFLLSTVVDCNALSAPANGQVSTNGTTFGETATYSCNTGYNLVGDNTRTCQATGNWSGSEPTCERMLLLSNITIKYVHNIFLLSTVVDCNALTDPANGQVSTTGTTFGETATYSCNTGYDLVGDNTRTCQATGNWSGSPPTCERMLLLSNMPIKNVHNVFLLSTAVDCNALSDPANGQVSTTGTTFRETATYSCNTGYDLVGDNTRTCQATGNWSGSAPTCERMLLLSNITIKYVHNVFLLSSAVDCNALSDPANGQVSTNGTTFGQTATYSCNTAYNLVGNSTRTCQATGNWSGSEPTCERMLLLSNIPIKYVHNVFLLSLAVDCSALSDPANGQVSTTGTTFGRTATYSCDTGYNLVGDSTRTCQATGEWSGSAPTCQRMLLLSNITIKYVHNVFLLLTAVDCNALSDPANGQVSHTAGTTFEQTATYSCDTGYNLVGDSTRTCGAAGVWSGSEPTCERMLLLSNMPVKYVHNVFLLSSAVDCNPLSDPANGQVSTNGTTFGETATYSCNAGYNLVGNSTRTCQATGNWSGSEPTCERMLLLSNIPIKYVHNVFLLSLAVDCSALSDPANGQVSTTGTTFGRTATYSCDTGYNLVGDSTRTCQATGEWSGSAPTCQRMLLLSNITIKYAHNVFLLLTAIDCNALSDPANGQVSHTAGTTFEQTATYSCDTGYNLVGDSTRTCQATGEWSGSAPTCQRMLLLSNITIKYVHNVFLLLTAIDCNALSDPANGQVSHTAGTTFEQTATYSCDTGYNLVGDSTRTCGAAGVWSGSEPTCERMLLLSNMPYKYVHNVFLLSSAVDCNPLSDPANGQVSTNGTTFGETATYSCNTAYNLVGNSTRTCQATGNWSGSEPTCERMLLLSNIPIKYVHNVFLLSLAVDCSALSDPANGQVSTTGTTFGQTATYSCDTGYNLVGDSTRTCQATGEWSGSAPTCQRMLLLSNITIKYVHNVFLLSSAVDCNALSDPANGQVSTTGTTFGETATYSCDTGYNLVGDSTRTCGAAGSWSGSEPTCERMLLLNNTPYKYAHNVFLLSTVVDCNALSDPANGQVNTTGTTFEETATYSCNTGYNLVGNSTRTCQATGNWSGSEPTCERMLLLNNTPYKYAHNVFLLSTVVDCNALSDPANGQVSTTGTTFGQTATYSCDTGYNLVGDGTRTCQATGEWSGSAPTCQCMLLLSNITIKYVHNVFLLSTVVDCNALSAPANGQVSHTAGTTFEQTATYSCDTGYNLVGDSTRTCQATGEWSGSAPTCQRMLLLSNITIKYVHNVFLLLTAIDCNALSAPANGQVSTNGTTFGETATYSCNTAYNLVGNSTRTCQATGNWSGSEPTCERMLLLSNIPIKYVHNVFLLSLAVDCSALSDPANGQVSTTGTTFGQTATYSCDTGYNLVGDSTRTCQATGEWSGSAPTCQRMLLLSNITIKYVHNVFLLSSAVDCNALSDPANGQVSTTGTTFGETATYSCDTGYNLVGDSTRTCGAAGSWSGSEPTCERMLLLNNTPYKYAHNVFLLSTVVDCNALSDPANGQVNTTGTTFEETATYSCNTGYNLVGNSTRTCQATGNWSGSEPTCERMLLLNNTPYKYAHNVFLLSTVVDCNALSDPANGQVSTTGTTFGQTATYSCDTGYNLVGDGTRTCQATGEWSGSAPTCQCMLLLSNITIKYVHNVFLLSTVVDCNALSAPANGQVSHTAGTTFEQTATYSCDTGYNLVGDSTRTCQATGEWSGSAPTCQRMLLLSNITIKYVHNVFLLLTAIDCNALSAPANGQVSHTAGTTFGETATYSCNTAYNLVGDSTRTCQATGNWSGSEPTCERMLLLSNIPIKYVHNVFLLSLAVDCSALSDPANGQVSTTGTTFGQTATYSCDTGYNLVGDSTRTCQATGEWSGSAPTCQRMLLLSNITIKYVHNVFLLSSAVDCNALSDPANGQVSTTGTTFGETATYSCDTGYNLVGDSTRTCGAAGNWSGSEPTCERMLLLNNTPYKYAHNVFLLSTVVDCNALSDPANGQVNTTGTTFEETATYSCNTGYNLVGNSTRTCQATGNWSGSEPTCERMLLLNNTPYKYAHNVFLLSTVVDCNALSDPANGQVSTTGTTFGQTATYSCDTGYNLVGDGIRTCQATGEWSGSAPTCQCMLLLSNITIKYVHNVFLLSTVVDCNALSAPANGQVSHTAGTTFEQTATYSCDTGYNLVGDSTRTCQATGEWSGSAPTCQRMLLLSNIPIKYVHNVFLLSSAVDCSALFDLANGQVSTTGTTFGETATYSCNTGYNLVGDSTRTCQATGEWSGSAPTCQRMFVLFLYSDFFSSVNLFIKGSQKSNFCDLEFHGPETQINIMNDRQTKFARKFDILMSSHV